MNFYKQKNWVHWLELHGSEAFQSPLIVAAVVGGWCL